MLAACCFSWFAVQRMVTDGRDRSRLARDMMFLVAPFVVLVSAHFLFRYAYYGEWLPNTYYAKHVRPWYESGFRYLWAAALETGLYLLPAADVSGPAHALANVSRWHVRAGAALCCRPHGLSAADWRRPLRVSPPGFLLASVGAPRGRRHCSSGLYDFGRSAEVATSSR